MRVLKVWGMSPSSGIEEKRVSRQLNLGPTQNHDRDSLMSRAQSAGFFLRLNQFFHSKSEKPNPCDILLLLLVTIVNSCFLRNAIKQPGYCFHHLLQEKHKL